MSGMPTIIVSDRLNFSPDLPDVQIAHWDNRPSIEGYPIVGLDLYFGEATVEGFYPLGRRHRYFYEMGTQVVRCLRAGGVVIALLGPVAISDRSLNSLPHMIHTRDLKRKRYENGPFPHPEHESSYDWLDQGFLEVTELDRIHSKPTDGVNWSLPGPGAPRYQAATRSYWVSIDGLEFKDTKNMIEITHDISDRSRWEVSLREHQSTVRLLARGAHTQLPTGATIDYLGLGGLLVLLPPFMLQQVGSANVQSIEVAMDLRDLGEHFRKQIGRWGS